MKFKIEKRSFLKVLQRVHAIVEKRNSMPILSNVLIEASDSKVNVVATDLEIFIKDACKAEVTEEGTLTVNCKKFFEIIKELPEEDIEIATMEGEKLNVKSARARFSIPGLGAKEFPAFPVFDEAALSEIETDTIKEMIDKTLFATSTDETRYNINGVLLEKEEDRIKMVATDGHRLAFLEREGKNIPGLEKGVILPRKGVMEVRKLLDEKEAPLFLGFTENNLTVKKGEAQMSVRLIEGEFPDYRQVIPEKTDKIFTVGRESFSASLKRVSILSSDKIKGVKFALSSGKLVLSSSTPENGEAVETLDVGYDGSDIEIAFNARYFIEVLEAIDTDEVKVELKEQLTPGVLKEAGSSDFTYVIMPMRL